MELFYSTDIRFGKKSCATANADKNLAAISTGVPKSVVLTGSEAEHCAKVLRHKEGDSIFIIDGVGGLYNCRIARMELPKKGEAFVECEVLEKSYGIGKRNYQLVMAVCPTKNIDRYEWFVEKATELGVNNIVPLISDHSIRTTIKKERLEAIALAATKQSLKAYLPKIEDAVSVSDFLNRGFGNNVLKLMAYCEDGEKKTIRQHIAEFQEKAEHSGQTGILEVVLMIGPEGDFSAPEIEEALRNGFLPVTLGQSRLRVETAAVVAVSEVYFSAI